MSKKKRRQQGARPGREIPLEEKAAEMSAVIEDVEDASAPETVEAAEETARPRKGRRHRRREERLTLAPAPHISRRDGTASMMLDVLVAALPALIFSGFYFFGYRVFAVVGVSVACCVLFEVLYRLILRKRQTVGDLSAVVTGVLLAMTLPVTVPYWVVAVGAFFAIVVVKQLYGGLGRNFMNPALAGRVFLFSFPALVNTWAQTRTYPGLGDALDAVTAPTPMAALHSGTLPTETLQEMLTGIRGGTIGEVSAALLLLGGIYLAARGVIRLRIPVCFLGTVALLTLLFPAEGVDRVQWMLYELLGGGLLVGAIFMATDPVTSPVTGWGQAVYGVGCGCLTVLLRYFGSYPEGVAFAILIMNAASWLLDRCTRPWRYGLRLFGRTGGGAKGKRVRRGGK